MRRHPVGHPLGFFVGLWRGLFLVLSMLLATWAMAETTATQNNPKEQNPDQQAPDQQSPDKPSLRKDAVATKTTPALRATAKQLAVEVRVDYPRPSELVELRDYIRPLALASNQPADLRLLEKRLLDIGRYRAARCTQDAQRVLCALSSARTIRRIVFVDIPDSVLKTELEKRIFMRPGQRLDAGDSKPQDRVARQRQRVQAYLERQGVFAAKVLIRALPVPGNPRQADLQVRVKGGHRAAVRNIEIDFADDEKDSPVSAETLRRRLRPWPWARFQPETLTAQLEDFERQLRSSGRYPEARILADYVYQNDSLAVDLSLTVRLGTRVQHQFIGAFDAQEEKDLLAKVTFGLSGSVDEVELGLSQEAMREALQRRGFFAAQVQGTMRSVSPRHVAVQWQIKHGLRAYIAEREVQLDPALRESILGQGLDLMSRPRQAQGVSDFYLSALPWVPTIVQRWMSWESIGCLVDAQVQADKRTLEQALVNAGYAEASVQTQVQRMRKGGLRLVFRVEKGPQFVLAGVQCHGEKALSCNALRQVLVHKKGGPFRPELLDVDKGRILSLYVSRGFPYANVELLLDFGIQGAVLRLDVNEGPQAHLSSIIVDGNVGTERDVILREIGTTGGGSLNPQKLDLGLRRLRRTGIFRRVGGRYLGLGDNSQNAAFLVRLEERRNLSLDSAVSFSTAELMALSAELRDRDLVGKMIDMRVNGRFGMFVGRHSAVNAQVLWPRVWGSVASLTARARYDLNARPNEAADFMTNLRLDPDLSLQQTQALTSGLLLDLALAPGFQLGTGYELALDWWRLTAVRDLENFAFSDPVRTGALSLRADFRQLDNPFDPRRGLQISGSAKWGARILGGDGDFAVLGLSTQGYWTWGRLTLASSLRGTLASLFNSREGISAKRYIPERDLIIAGGDRSVRGHQEGSIGVTTRSQNDAGDWQIVQQPGLLGLVVNTEARLRLFPLWLGDLQLASFVDAAWVGDSPFWYLDHVDQSAGIGLGAGLRYVTPVGPIALDLAIDPARPTQPRLHVLFGYSF